MKKIRDIIEHITRRGVKTICHPRAIINGKIELSTSPENYFNAYMIDRDKLDITESGGLVTTLPKKSNIRNVEPVVDKITKERGGFRASHRGSSPKSSQISWIDGFNRYMATKTETQDGITFSLRADLANEISQRGNMFVQCDESFCDILIPSKISVNMNKYSVAMQDKDGI
jgi:hypothetical protein